MHSGNRTHARTGTTIWEKKRKNKILTSFFYEWTHFTIRNCARLRKIRKRARKWERNAQTAMILFYVFLVWLACFSLNPPWLTVIFLHRTMWLHEPDQISTGQFWLAMSCVGVESILLFPCVIESNSNAVPNVIDRTHHTIEFVASGCDFGKSFKIVFLNRRKKQTTLVFLHFDGIPVGNRFSCNKSTEIIMQTTVNDFQMCLHNYVVWFSIFKYVFRQRITTRKGD